MTGSEELQIEQRKKVHWKRTPESIPLGMVKTKQG